MLLKGGQLHEGGLSWESNYLVCGVPEPPAGISGVDSISSEVLRWGDTEGKWGPKSFTDGSSLASNAPETRRCGHSCVQLDPQSLLP
eukprot:2980908-Pyramimonas_sp.AAC.1